MEGPRGERLPGGTTPRGEWGDWLAPSVAWERVLGVWSPASAGAHDAALLAASGRVLAVDVRAPRDSPGFDRSAMDGYALRAGDVAAASDDDPARLRFIGDVAMGTASTLAVGAGEAAWVATGSMIPEGADSVVMVERTARNGDEILVRQAANAGDNVVRRGADLRAGDVVLRAGRLVRPQDVAVLASMGVDRVGVRERPRVALISGGDELVSPGGSLGPGQIYDANSYAMAAQVESWGGIADVRSRVRDRLDEVRAALSAAVAVADVVLLSGGSSVGVKDLTATAIDMAGAPGVVVHGVAMRPGRPTIIGVVDGALVIGIPGNPVSAMVACEVFARPAVEHLLGLEPLTPPGHVGAHMAYGRLAEPVRSQVGRQDYVRVRLEGPADAAVVRQVPGGSGIIRSMVDADGLLIVPSDRDALAAGETVAVHLF